MKPSFDMRGATQGLYTGEAMQTAYGCGFRNGVVHGSPAQRSIGVAIGLLSGLALGVMIGVMLPW